MSDPRFVTIAVTGGTGFVGRHLLAAAKARGIRVRALARTPRQPVPEIDWVYGALDRPAALAELVHGADAVIHVAGVINARDRAGFEAGNVEGTLAMVEAARAGGVPRFIHVSSLAAREPQLSDYGWSKARSETIVAASGLDWTTVRPPAVYGPGDKEMLELFRMARRGVVLLPPGGRLSVIAAPDLAELLLNLLPYDDGLAETYEPDDGRAGGWDHREFARALGAAVGRPWARPLPVPVRALRTASWLDLRIRGGRAKLTADRVRYFCHPDWVGRPTHRPPAEVWRPRVETAEGLKITAESYRERGWL